jgi:hypothetical protein
MKGLLMKGLLLVVVVVVLLLLLLLLLEGCNLLFVDLKVSLLVQPGCLRLCLCMCLRELLLFLEVGLSDG